MKDCAMKTSPCRACTTISAARWSEKERTKVPGSSEFVYDTGMQRCQCPMGEVSSMRAISLERTIVYERN